MIDSLIIYGAGGGGKKIAKILMDLNYNIVAFVDSDQQKWNQSVLGIPIYGPDFLDKTDNPIIVVSVGEKEIFRYLESAGHKSRICRKEECIMQYINEHMLDYAEFGNKIIDKSRKHELILTSESGFKNWGVERYTRTEAEVFLKYGITVSIFTDISSCDDSEKLKPYLVEFDYKNNHYLETIKKEIAYIIEHLPCTIQDNCQCYTLIAAIIAKKLYPNDILLLSMVHNDLDKLISSVVYLQQNIDYISAVSSDIITKLNENIPKSKILYKESPVDLCYNFTKFYQLNADKPVRIAYGARVSKNQKRTHLLFEVIRLLDAKGVNYQFNIVGTGEYINEFLEELNQKQFGEKVNYLGVFTKAEMQEYWYNNDIFISVSEFEGTSLAMLEAMGAGCVPIVTAVSGTVEYVETGYNGYVCNIHDMNQIAESIELLENNRDLLPLLGLRSRNIVEKKCSMESYKEYWKNKLML